MSRGKSGPNQLARDTVDRCCHDRPCVHVEPTLVRSVNTGASHEVGEAEQAAPAQQPTKVRERGPGPQPAQDEPVTSYRLG